ncbi:MULTISPECIES: AGE family epimerase/isomerase [Saccharothrix]|uniref:AGE family epimerase/isomerase n=1 Tax=Saccharothrix TaxID=2071 RepID=UPI0009FAC437|nr:AGE family epimerase/isomerase [Saccharothrix sp. CB00851]
MTTEPNRLSGPDHGLRWEAETELRHRVLPFWLGLVDREHGGVHGYVDADLVVDQTADKGAVMACRFLWTFSAAYRAFGDLSYMAAARDMYRFVTAHLVDPVHGGVFWSVDHTGAPADTDKHVYAQAFALYAVSEYHRATDDPGAAAKAAELYEVVTGVGFDPATGAYREQSDRSWVPKPNVLLGEEYLAEITMNTHLHVLEALTAYHAVAPSPAAVAGRIATLLETFRDRLYDPRRRSLRVFLGADWRELGELVSFGHDIEASWLIDEACREIGADLPDAVIGLAGATAERAVLADGSVANEAVAGRVDATRVWWVQAEAVVGFVNAHERTGDPAFLALARGTWDYIAANMVDPRPTGEWFYARDADNVPLRKEVAGPWKCCYHNGRLCLQLVERLGVDRADRSR